MIVLVTEGCSGFAATRVGVRHRLRVRRWASRLDRDLAGGASPESTRERALHAQRLVAPSSRRRLARSIQRAQAAALPSAAPRLHALPLCRDRVRQASQELDVVRERLVAGSPLPARGVAMLRVLLTNGSGPLYQRRSRDDLRSQLTEIAAALAGDELDDVRARRWG
jgi:hypothetical protein